MYEDVISLYFYINSINFPLIFGSLHRNPPRKLRSSGPPTMLSTSARCFRCAMASRLGGNFTNPGFPELKGPRNPGHQIPTKIWGWRFFRPFSKLANYWPNNKNPRNPLFPPPHRNKKEGRVVGKCQSSPSYNWNPPTIFWGDQRTALTINRTFSKASSNCSGRVRREDWTLATISFFVEAKGVFFSNKERKTYLEMKGRC